eukprot:TRINITY_DN15948_c0_g1_i1.p2 TRINITY_DN15948_c0_g1~~TRINITY_DN15948_c0_g1_i1.p2  ORF type:complete len:83 (+),score=18.07 TRINITY_DN15948_c0_g1_i1:216-464(+)
MVPLFTVIWTFRDVFVTSSLDQKDNISNRSPQSFATETSMGTVVGEDNEDPNGELRKSAQIDAKKGGKNGKKQKGFPKMKMV